MRARLQPYFGSWQAALTTLSLSFLLLWLVHGFLDWAVWQANFVGQSREACTGHGACWVFVKEHLKAFMVGTFYPASEVWRVGVLFAFLVLLSLCYWLCSAWRRSLMWAALVLVPVLGGWLLFGGGPLPEVEPARLGGLTLTLLIAFVGIASSLPLGTLLALARRSKLPILRMAAICFIEFWRGVPLITVLFMASVMLPLFLPQDFDSQRFDKLWRALIGVTLFSSAYMAEVVRGGLQAIGRGQYEAAAALGLGYWQSMAYVVLPQALIKVIPGIVNTFIGLLKDTTLVMIIGMFDLLGTVQSSVTNSKWLGFAVEGYVFAGLVFWALCFGLSRLSMQIEKRTGFEATAN